MSDMYGAVRSNTFKVKNFEAFREWFEENCYFGDNIEVWGDKNGVAFGGEEQYPSAYPRKAYDAETGEIAEWDLKAFAREFRKHLEKGEILEVCAAGNEKLRYVAAQFLRITKSGHVTFNDWYAGN